MEFKSNQAQPNARPSASTTTNANQTGGGAPAPVKNMQQSSKNSSTILLAVIVVLIILLGLGGAYMWQKKSSNALAAVQSEHYQAVFLTNGQVYFGKIAGGTEKYLTLTNIYYLQAPQQPVQPDKQGAQQQQPTQLTVVKLGGELHGPMDAMYISRDQVLFWENLKDDGKVVQAIKNPQKQQ